MRAAPAAAENRPAPPAAADYLGQLNARLSARLNPLGRLAVLLSGGVDSSLLAAAATSALGAPQVLALTFLSPLTPPEDAEAARGVAAALELRHLVLPFDALRLPEVARNRPERCYACKREIIRLAREAAGREGFKALAEGSNADDMDEAERPGLKAVREGGLLSPLAEAGLDKPAIRELARTLGLATWGRPASPCLATRFPAGHALSAAEAALLWRAEQRVREALGLNLVRLRWRGEGCVSLEVGPEELEAARAGAGALASVLSPLGLNVAGPPLPYGAK